MAKKFRIVQDADADKIEALLSDVASKKENFKIEGFATIKGQMPDEVHPSIIFTTLVSFDED